MKVRVRLTKLKDEKFNGKHPNDINEGYIKEGELKYPIESGFNINLETGYKFFMTSDVKDIIEVDENNQPTLVRTNNSIYKIEYLN